MTPKSPTGQRGAVPVKRLQVGITPKLTIVFVLFAALLVATVAALAFLSARAALLATNSSELVARAVEKETGLRVLITIREAELMSFAGSPYIRDQVAGLLTAGSNSARQEAHRNVVENLSNWVGGGGGLRGLLVIETQTGQVIAASDAADEGQYRGDRPYFVNGKSGAYIQNPYYDPALQGPAMTIGVPITSRSGQVIAVLAGHLDLAELDAIISLRTGLRPTDDAYLVNTEHLFVTQPRLTTEPAVLQLSAYTQGVETCLAGSNGVLVAPDYRGVPVMMAYRWIPERQLCLIVKMDQAEALVPVRSIGNTILLTTGLALLMASALAYLLARTITRPLHALQAGVTRFGQGERDMRLPDGAGDELGTLARAFNTMAGLISTKDAQLRASALNLESTVAERTADLNRSNLELEQFAYVASHDLQEPLRMVTSYVQLLQRRYQGRLDQDADEFIAFAVDGAKRMQRLINDLLAFSRVGTRGRDLAVTSSEDALTQALESLSLFIEDNHAQVIHDPLPLVLGDQDQLVQLFQNLISNAVKFHGVATPAVRIVASRLAGSSQGAAPMWQFSVCDNGIGIDPQYFERIFVIFQRLHSRESYEGTGIGLAVCKKIVERHGGRIWVESQPGQGTTVSFSLPAIVTEKDAGATKTRREDAD